MKLYAKLAALLLTGTIITGCSSTTSVTLPDDNNDSVVFENRSRSNQLIFLSVEDVKSRNVGKLLQVQSSVRNKSTFKIEFKYQFRFYDKDGFWVGEDSRPWTSVTLEGKDTKQIKALAPSPAATNVKIFIKK